jgi:hypothetical protein
MNQKEKYNSNPSFTHQFGKYDLTKKRITTNNLLKNKFKYVLLKLCLKLIYQMNTKNRKAFSKKIQTLKHYQISSKRYRLRSISIFDCILR